ncbi:MAG: RNA methyltransferase, partial [Lentisphaeria bacterium]|nr:RNA methyltransferase [Lentisphaeria bacterium]NQZ68722.1 RNA methyltransferase [Lentisphaeria bacterium]
SMVICDACTDIFNPNVVCASVGTLFTTPFAEATSDHFIQWCKAEKIKIIATTPDTDLVYSDVDLTGPIAVVMGTEQYGLSDKWFEHADVKVKIPMYGKADSLNVASATSLVVFEAIRQRRLAGIID